MIRRFLRKIISALTNFLALAPVSLHTPQHNLGFRGNRLPVFFVRNFAPHALGVPPGPFPVGHDSTNDEELKVGRS